MKIAAVIVTYNRFALLKVCIDALRNQTIVPDSIIIINNGSTDGTTEWLKEQTDLRVYHQENTGSSGGFHRGIKQAYDDGYDWIWIMDDDAFPDANCLKELISNQYFTAEKNTVLAPVVIEGDDVDKQHRGFFNKDKIQVPLQVPITNDDLLSDETYLDLSFVSFIGMFVGSNILKKVGFPNAEYFILNDDVEFSLRISLSGFKMHLVKTAIIFHKKINEDKDFKLRNYIHDPAEAKDLVKPVTKAQRKANMYLNQFDHISNRFIFNFLSKRNLIRTIITHYGFNGTVLKFLITDFYNSLRSIANIKFNKMKIFKMYFAMYKQAITGKFNNARLFAFSEDENK